LDTPFLNAAHRGDVRRLQIIRRFISRHLPTTWLHIGSSYHHYRSREAADQVLWGYVYNPACKQQLWLEPDENPAVGALPRHPFCFQRLPADKLGQIVRRLSPDF
jgi:hypothetical protein